MHRQRLNGLHQLAVGILGPNACIQDMVDHLNSNISVVIRDRITIWGQLQSDMGALCRFAGWHVPKEFVVYPTINSPAALLYWRILLYLLEQLPESDRAEFNQSYGTQRPKGSTSTMSSGKSLRDSAQPGVVPRHIESQLVEEQDPQRTRVISTEGPMEHLRISIGADPRGSPHGDPTWDPVSRRPFAFDSHFHFDRTAKKLLHVEDVSMVTIEEILEFPLPSTPACPVKLIGGGGGHGLLRPRNTAFHPLDGWSMEGGCWRSSKESSTVFGLSFGADSDVAGLQPACQGPGRDWFRPY